MAGTATKTRRAKNAPYLADIDPRDLLANPRNVRAQHGDLTELTASIAARGVLQALLVVPEEGGHLIVAGHRRAAAAAAALEADTWPEGLSPTVPCLVRPDLAGVPADQVVSMLIENDQRADITASERALAYSQLELFGLDTTEIARRTGRTLKHVTNSLRLVGLGETATAAADAGKLTLEDVAELAEFEDDPKAMKRILQDVDTSWGVKHKVSEERRKRETDAAVAKLRAELEAAGVTIARKPKGWPWNCREALVTELRTADDKTIDPSKVQAKPGFAALVTEGYGNARAEIICLDPESHGYKRVGHTYYKSPAKIAEEERAAEARELRKVQLSDARGVRERFLVERFGNAKVVKGLLVEAVRATVEKPMFVRGGDADLIEALAGGDINETASAGQDRLNRLLVAMWITAEEHNFNELCGVRPWGCNRERAVAWLDRLAEAGYTLSEIEATMRTELAAPEVDEDEEDVDDEDAADEPEAEDEEPEAEHGEPDPEDDEPEADGGERDTDPGADEPEVQA
ncbi:ParB/RepB/Spo0J family partition protein [Plantactinospora sp. CA-294935]|uniref:ParB/RepB/Spo0J family partition protein n=1 Tax=Plantactinospora sp. CA-294935 TaxID=3240012 RepID=UPI003D8C8A68